MFINGGDLVSLGHNCLITRNRIGIELKSPTDSNSSPQKDLQYFLDQGNVIEGNKRDDFLQS